MYGYALNPCPTFDKIHLAADFAAFEEPGLSCNRSLFDSFMGQAELLVNLQHAGVNAERLRKSNHAFAFLDDDEVHSITDKLTS